MTLLIKNAFAIKNDDQVPCSVLLKDDKISKIEFADTLDCSVGTPILDAGGLLLMPGIIDPHVHLRDPGFNHKEDLYSGSCAAAAGGVTTVFDMPNTNPPTITVERLKEKKQLAKDKNMVVNYAFHFGGVESSVNEIKKAKGIPGTKVYMDLTTGKHIVRDEASLLEIFKASRIVLVHAEEENVVVASSIARKAKKTLYCCHISLAKEIDYIKEAKTIAQKMGKNVFCEVTPHHLFLSKEGTHDAFTLMKPNLRSKSDVIALWKAINDGVVDTIGTDHAPHTIKEKKSKTPPFGVPGLETSLPLMLTAYKEGHISLGKIQDLMCSNPAKIFGVDKRGELKEGYYADLVLVDLDSYKEVNSKNLFTKCGWSPFQGRELTGWPVYTFVNGNLIYDASDISKSNDDFDKGKINNIPGREVKFND